MSKTNTTTKPATNTAAPAKGPSEAYLKLLKKEVPTLDVKKLAGKG
ncbi:MAG: hypothetical protein AAF433_05745 [Bacteroidota bacterium]